MIDLMRRVESDITAIHEFVRIWSQASNDAERNDPSSVMETSGRHRTLQKWLTFLTFAPPPWPLLPSIRPAAPPPPNPSIKVLIVGPNRMPPFAAPFCVMKKVDNPKWGCLSLCLQSSQVEFVSWAEMPSLAAAGRICVAKSESR